MKRSANADRREAHLAAKLIHSPAPGDLVVEHRQRPRHVRFAQASEPSGLGIWQGLCVTSHRLREQKFRKFSQHRLRSRTTGGDLRRGVLECRAYPFCGSSLLDIELEQGRKRRDHGVAFGAAATEKPAYHLRVIACAAVMDREKPAVFARPDDIGAGDRGNIEIAAHQMQVVARQQNYLAGPDDGTLSTLTFDANANAPSTT